MQVVLAYLLNQTVIGELSQETEPSAEGMVTFLNRPHQIFAVPMQGRLQVSILPMCGNFGATPPISRYYPTAEHLLAPLLEAPKELADEYIKAVTGISMAAANSPILRN